MSREIYFRKGNQSNKEYSEIVEACRKYTTKHCRIGNCEKCPFQLSNGYCLLHVICVELEDFVKPNKKYIKKKFIDCSAEELSCIVNEPFDPDSYDLDDEADSGLEKINKMKKFVEALENCEVEILVDDGDEENANV